MTGEDFIKQLPDLAADYQPDPKVLSKIGDISLLMLIGPSGVGKTTLINKLGLHYVPSDTTRDIRPGEKEGEDFYFLKDYDKAVSDIRAGQLVQIAVGAAGDLYSTHASSYPESGWGVMPVMADVVPIFRKLGFKETISAFIVPPSYSEWMRRMKSHPITSEQLIKRLAEAKRSLNLALSDQQIHLILNDNLEKAVAQTKELLDGKVDENREQTARQAAQAMLDGIN